MLHPAQNLTTVKPIVYTATSWKYFAYRMFISKFVLEQGGVPLNPFMIFDYFMADIVDRDVTREANNNLVRIADEVWVFGSITDGVKVEIDHARAQGKSVRFFSISKPAVFTEVSEANMSYE
jgi:hypothetical protein